MSEIMDPTLGTELPRHTPGGETSLVEDVEDDGAAGSEPEPELVDEPGSGDDFEQEPQAEHESEFVDQEVEPEQENEPEQDEEEPEEPEQEQEQDVKDVPAEVEEEEEEVAQQVKEELQDEDVPMTAVKDEPCERNDKEGFEEAPVEEIKHEYDNGESMDIKEEPVEVKVEPTEEGRRGEKLASEGTKMTPAAKRSRPDVELVCVENEFEFDKSLVVLDWYNSDMSLIISKEDRLSAYPLTGQGFGYVWHGVRATYGFTKGKVFYEVKVMEHLSVPHLEADEQHPHVIRAGWSVDDTGLMLGEEPLSYGYGGTAKASSNLKFKDYGIKFGKGDVVGCFLDLDVQPAVISFTVNGEHQGIAYEIRHREIGDAALFPHIVTKNSSFQVNFGQEDPWFEPLTGYIAIQKVPLEERVLATQGPEKREDCEEMEPNMFYSRKTRGKDVAVQELPYESEDEESSDGELYQPNQGSDTSDESESENETSSLKKEYTQTSKRDIKERPIIWRTVDIGQKSTEVPKWKGKLPEATTLKTPLEYFKQFFDEDLLQMIVDQSNLYSTQQRGISLNLTVEELEQFIGTVLHTSIVHLPRMHMYWSKACWVPQIAEVFSRQRWEEIKKYLHFNDNSNVPAPTDENRDKLFKIRPLVDRLLQKFQAIPQQQMLCIDEQIVPFKCKSSLKQYNPKKKKTWGYKIFVMCDTNGLVHNFEIYTGEIDPAPNEPDLGASSNIVLRLASIVQINMSHLLYFDNWFSSLRLVIELHKKGIYSLGIVRQNRLKGCRFTDDKNMRKIGRGTYEEKCATVEGVEVDVLKWFDTKCVTFVSTYAAGEPYGIVERWNKKDKQYDEVPCPNVVLEYNKFMGGVDLLDGLVAYYRIKLKSNKYYMKFFFHFLDMVTVNSWLLYRRDGNSLEIPSKKLMDGLAFRSQVAEALTKCRKDVTRKRSRKSRSEVEKGLIAKKRKGRVTPVPTKDIRMDSVGHWPLPSDCQRCKFPGCKRKATMKCSKCQVHLCLNKQSNCFLSFHTH
ncbi:uncharacterized protein LOC143022126 isoform X1 [Oratosquilla oratoria]|uniref:uncharacterized protein LOC143022126 isoform X1 n=1 Tax=Oratosquilla oratoria TaxID=337810 RepID=UPI003F76EEF3